MDHDQPTPGCPDVEALAAYVDAVLDPNARAAVAAHLARCDACLELVTETARSLAEWSTGDDEDGAGEDEAGPACLGWRGSVRLGVVAALAATAIVAIRPRPEPAALDPPADAALFDLARTPAEVAPSCDVRQQLTRPPSPISHFDLAPRRWDAAQAKRLPVVYACPEPLVMRGGPFAGRLAPNAK